MRHKSEYRGIDEQERYFNEIFLICFERDLNDNIQISFFNFFASDFVLGSNKASIINILFHMSLALRILGNMCLLKLSWLANNFILRKYFDIY